MTKNTAYLAAFGYSLLVGLSFLMTKLMVPHASPPLILAHRFTIAFIVYLTYQLLTQSSVHYTREKFLALLPLMPFYPVLFFTLQIHGLKFASSSEAGIIFATIPILTLVLLTLLGTRPSKLQLLCVLTSVSGVLIIFARNTGQLVTQNMWGILLLFMSALSFSIYTIGVKKCMKVVSVSELTFFSIFIGCLSFNLMALPELLKAPSLLKMYIMPFNSSTYSLCIFYSGSFAMVGTSLFSNYALKHLSPPQFSVFANLSTLISILAGAIILKETLGSHHYIGSTFILLGVIGTNFSHTIEKHFFLSLKKT